ncbi:MAG: pyridoxamine 5'-phosphate oxidase family protein [bacterium]|nr:pyridoxamine 5'-phosphate oxidase family protein [bacterium]
MIEVKDMSSNDVEAFLGRVNYGHLGCSSSNHPYVLPIHFAYDRQTIYIYTTEGKKSEMIDSNPEICLQVEKVVDNENWVSVIVVGDAKRLVSADDREAAYASIVATNPSLTPAISYRWLDDWVRENKDAEVVYRIYRKTTSGRRAGDVPNH